MSFNPAETERAGDGRDDRPRVAGSPVRAPGPAASPASARVARGASCYYGTGSPRAPERERNERAARAARSRPAEADAFLHLGRAYLSVGKLSLALEAFDRGRLRDPSHPDLLDELRRHDRRGRPALRWLPRSHAWNVWLGRLGGRLGPRRARSPRPG